MAINDAVLWRLVIAASVGGAIAQAVYEVVSAERRPIAWGLIVGGAAAWGALRFRRTRIQYLALGVVSGVALFIALWAVLTTAHASRAVSVAGAVVCPIAAYAVGHFDESRAGPGPIRSRRSSDR